MTRSSRPGTPLIPLKNRINHNIHSIDNNLTALLLFHLILEVNLLLEIYLTLDDALLHLVVNYVVLYVLILKVEGKAAGVAGCGGCELDVAALVEGAVGGVEFVGLRG